MPTTTHTIHLNHCISVVVVEPFRCILDQSSKTPAMPTPYPTPNIITPMPKHQRFEQRIAIAQHHAQLETVKRPRPCLVPSALLVLVERSLDLVEKIRVVEIVVRVQLAERMLRKQHIRRRAIKWISAHIMSALRTPSDKHISRKGTYTWKQSIMNATASGPIVSWISSGMGGVSPFAIL